MKSKDTKLNFVFFKNEDIIYLDNAATTQKPQVVIDSMNEYYERYCSNIHRGSHDLGSRATTKFENARDTIAKYIGAGSRELIFTRGTTEAINLVASSFVKDKYNTVILTHLEHHSNIIPWQLQGLNIKVIPMDKDLNIDIKEYEKMLQENVHSFVSITHVSNVFGIVNPIKELVKIAHKYDCEVLIDGAQALAHINIDVKDLDADFYAISSHKAYGPTGIGALYGKYNLLLHMKPYQGGGSMIADVSFENSIFLDPPMRFEAGTQAIAEVIGFASALTYLKNVDDIEIHDKELLSYARASLESIDGIKLYTDALNVCGNLSFTINNIHHEDIAILLSKQRIMLRSGHHCAMPLMKHLGIDGTVRLSFAIYNTKEDIDDTIKALRRAIEMLL